MHKLTNDEIEFVHSAYQAHEARKAALAKPIAASPAYLLAEPEVIGWRLPASLTSFHGVWPQLPAGYTSWYDYNQAIYRLTERDELTGYLARVPQHAPLVRWLVEQWVPVYSAPTTVHAPVYAPAPVVYMAEPVYTPVSPTLDQLIAALKAAFMITPKPEPASDKPASDTPTESAESVQAHQDEINKILAEAKAAHTALSADHEALKARVNKMNEQWAKLTAAKKKEGQ